MKIATFNINNVNKRLPNLLAWLRAAKPDVVCLQELKATDRDFPAAALEKAGYGAVWRGEKSWNGVAILARDAEPVLTRSELPGDPRDAQARYIEAAVRGVLIASLYAPNGNPQPGPKFTYKLAWMARLARHALELHDANVPVVLAGDYNVVPTDFDIYAMKSYVKNALVQPQPRAAFRRLIDQGWTDAIRTLHPDAPMYTFWDYMRNRWPRDAGLRLDHLLLSRHATARLADAGVDRDVRGQEDASDHAPAWIMLADKPMPKRTAIKNKDCEEDRAQDCRQESATKAHHEDIARTASGHRRRLLRASRLSRATEDDPDAEETTRGRDPRFCEFPAPFLSRGAAARRCRCMGHAGEADLPAQGLARLPERAQF